MDRTNPLDLSLDEVIQLNKLRNQTEQLASCSTVTGTVKKEKNGLVNGFSEEKAMAIDDEAVADTIQERLRTNRPNGVFDRLGWKKPNTALNKRRTAAQDQALRALKNAQNNVFKRPVSRVVKNPIRPYPLRLTSSALQRHNQIAGNFTVRRGNGPGSVFSMSTNQSMRPTFFRHSTKKCLDPEIQQLIQSMLTDGQPAMVQSDMGTIVDDFSSLPHYKVTPQSTGIPLHIRFEMNG